MSLFFMPAVMTGYC